MSLPELNALRAQIQANLLNVIKNGQAISQGSNKYTFSRILNLGSRGEDVRQLQLFLQQKGYMNAEYITGIFDPYTRSVLIAFQQANGLTQTGVFDAITRNYINSLNQTSSTIVNVGTNIGVPSNTPNNYDTYFDNVPSNGTFGSEIKFDIGFNSIPSTMQISKLTFTIKIYGIDIADIKNYIYNTYLKHGDDIVTTYSIDDNGYLSFNLIPSYIGNLKLYCTFINPSTNNNIEVKFRAESFIANNTIYKFNITSSTDIITISNSNTILTALTYSNVTTNISNINIASFKITNNNSNNSINLSNIVVSLFNSTGDQSNISNISNAHIQIGGTGYSGTGSINNGINFNNLNYQINTNSNVTCNILGDVSPVTEDSSIQLSINTPNGLKYTSNGSNYNLTNTNIGVNNFILNPSIVKHTGTGTLDYEKHDPVYPFVLNYDTISIPAPAFEANDQFKITCDNVSLFQISGYDIDKKYIYANTDYVTFDQGYTGSLQIIPYSDYITSSNNITNVNIYKLSNDTEFSTGDFDLNSNISTLTCGLNLVSISPPATTNVSSNSNVEIFSIDISQYNFTGINAQPYSIGYIPWGDYNNHRVYLGLSIGMQSDADITLNRLNFIGTGGTGATGATGGTEICNTYINVPYNSGDIEDLILDQVNIAGNTGIQCNNSNLKISVYGSFSGTGNNIPLKVFLKQNDLSMQTYNSSGGGYFSGGYNITNCKLSDNTIISPYNDNNALTLNTHFNIT